MKQKRGRYTENMKPANEGKCWAASLGGCGAKINREHLATESLFGKRIRVSGGFLGTPDVETSIKKLVANILCEDHNKELGGTADIAALRLYRHFKASHNPTQLRGSQILRPPVDKKVSGVNFGRWLCKTHCNFMVSNGMTPDPAYIRYAFSYPPGKPIFIYFAAGLGDVLRLVDKRDPVVSWRQFLSDDQPGFDGFSLKLAGFETVVTTAPIRRNGQQMIDRIQALEWTTPLGPFRIIFNWNGEPTVIRNAP